MKMISPDVEALLTEYRAELPVFEQLVSDFRTGKRTAAMNVLSEPMAAPPETAYGRLPAPGSLEVEKLADLGRTALRDGQVAAFILNGGMATRFGGKVKGCVEVFDGRAFIDIKFDQLKKVQASTGAVVPVILLNSFATEATTKQYLEEHGYLDDDRLDIRCITQYLFPRITAAGEPYEGTTAKLSCYGPGHGDFIYALQRSGQLHRLRREGVRLLYFSNIDNLGATLDPAILGWHLHNNSLMTVEVAEKRAGDKGGVPALVGGRPQLVEGFSIPAEFDQDSIPVFNTATYTFTLDALDHPFELPWYVVSKEVNGEKIIQFEHLAGDLSKFLETQFLVVDRDQRFFPIKSPADLETTAPRLKELFG